MLGLPGVESITVNLNDDTFVPLRLSDRQESGFHPSKQEMLQRRKGGEEMLNPDEVMQRAFKKRRMLLVIGDPGLGKTTLLKYYALCALEDDHFKRLGFAAPPTVFYYNNTGATTPVSNYPEGATPEGLYDMAGNVWEWMENWYDKDKEWVAWRGGDYTDKADALRCSSRVNYDPRLNYYDYVGFRVIRSSHSSSS